MLGELIGETRGKRIVRTVLSSTPFKVQVSFEDAGKMVGVDVTGFGSYTSEVRPDGSIYGEGNGIYMSGPGEAITWTATGIGKFLENGTVSYRGMLYYRSASPKFAKLNNVAGAFEYESTAAGETHSKVWEWK